MGFFGLLVIGLVFFVLIGAGMGFAANGRALRAEQSILRLQRQVQLLEQALKNSQPVPPSIAPAAEITKDSEKIAPEIPLDPKPSISQPASEPVSTKEPEPVMAAATMAPTKTDPPTDPPRPQPAMPDWMPKKASAAAAPRSFEFEIGAKWTVWVGGLALLLGAVFLLRYSIESGFFTPGMRVGMAWIMGLTLLSAGEWLRRGEKLPKFAAEHAGDIFENSYIPGVLTGVGVFTLLGTVFAAHELYNFIGAPMAFILMGLISLGALALGLLHGPYISALGLAAAFATPLLIQTDRPDMTSLLAYLAIISAAAWTLAYLRDWGWLAIAALAGGALWLVKMAGAPTAYIAYWPWLAYFALNAVANLYLTSNRALFSTQADRPKPGLLALNHVGLTAFVLAGLQALALLALIEHFEENHLATRLIAIAFTWLMAASPLYKRNLQPNIWIAALFGAVFLIMRGFGTLPMTATLVAIILGLATYYGSRGEGRKQWVWSIPAAALPILAVLASEVSKPRAPSETHLGLYFLGGAAALVGGAWWLNREKANPSAISIYLIGSALAFCLAIFIALDPPANIAASAAGMIIFAGLFGLLPNTAARALSLAMAVLTLAVTLFFVLDKPGNVSEQFLLNELWTYFALPALIAFVSARLLRRSKTDMNSEGLLGMSFVFGALFILFQIRHYMTDGALYSRGFTFEELGLYVAVGLISTLGRRFMKLPEPRPINLGINPGQQPLQLDRIIPGILTFFTWLTLGVFAFFLCVTLAPLFNEGVLVKGGRALNTLTIGYLIPVVLMGAILWQQRETESDPQSNAMRGLALVGLLLYVTSQVRVFFSGMKISLLDNFPDGLESYTITASWLLIGVVALAIGVKFKRRAFRLGSGIIIILTVLKAFLIDMATLEGVLRAISFVILGVVLIVIGRVYQKLLFEDQKRFNSASS